MCEICLAVVLRPPMGTVAGSCGSRPARALWSLRRPPHRRHLVADRWLGALSPCCPAGSCRRHSNFARNSPAACSNIECASLGLQRFRVVSKSDRGKLCAKFVWWWPCERVLALPTCCSLHRGRVLWFLGVFRTSGACCAVVACPDSASHSVQNSPCLVLC